MAMLDFQRELLLNNARRKELDMVAAQAVKNFADALAKARNEDALGFLAAGRANIDGLSENGKRNILYAMACDKLDEVGYYEFAELMRSVK